jgi:hypothetical protein
MRSFLNDIYFGKTREIVGNLRTIETTTELGLRDKLAEDLCKKFTTNLINHE